MKNLEKEKGHIGEVVVDLSGGGRGRGGWIFVFTQRGRDPWEEAVGEKEKVKITQEEAKVELEP